MRISAGTSQLAVETLGGLYFLKYVARGGEHIQQPAPKRHGGRLRGFRLRFRRQLRLFHISDSGLNAARWPYAPRMSELQPVVQLQCKLPQRLRCREDEAAIPG